jgi:hypothetical protein
MTRLIEIAAVAFVGGVIVARLYWNGLISKAKSLSSGLGKKLYAVVSCQLSVAGRQPVGVIG